MTQAPAPKASMPTPGTTPVPSPCVNICRMDEAKGWCEGCGRTLDEIALWSLLDDAEKHAVWADLQRRLGAVPRPGPA